MHVWVLGAGAEAVFFEGLQPRVSCNDHRLTYAYKTGGGGGSLIRSCLRGGSGGWRPIVLATDLLAVLLFLNAAVSLFGA